MKNTTRYVCLGALLILCANSQTRQQIWLASFDQVWTTIEEKHWDPKLNGVDWNAARLELRPKVENSSDPNQARQHTEELLARLGHSHVGIIPASNYNDLTGKSGDGESGLKFELIGGDAIVANGPYAGWILREIDGKRVHERIARTKSRLHAQLSVRNMLRGEPGEDLELLLEDQAGKLEAIKQRLSSPSGKIVRFGHLPPIHLKLSYERLNPDCGYIRISSFFDPEAIEDLMRKATRDCLTCKGIILDLRQNPGGIGGLASAVAGWFVDKSITLGTCYFRHSQLRLLVNPRPEPFLGRLAILTDELSMSTSEFLAGGLKDLQRARIFGRPTAGAALPSSIEKLPSGDGFQYTTANYISAGGKPLEGIGVQPDVLIEPTRQQLINGLDATRDAAIQWIKKD